MATDNNFAQFIENLRISRNISRDDFVQNVISLRQYQRFLNGESSIKTSSMISLLEKLEINTISGFVDLMNKNNKELSNLTSAYGKFIEQNYKETLELLKNINLDKIKNTTNRKLYQYMDIACNVNLKVFPESQGVLKLKSIVNYPETLQKDALSYVEISILLFIADYTVRIEKDFRIPNFMFDVLKNKNNLPDKTFTEYLPIYYSQVARHLGGIGEIKKSLSMAIDGLDYCEKHQIFFGTKSLLFYKAIGEKQLYDDQRYVETTRRLFAALTLFKETKLTRSYYRTIKKQLNLTKEDFIK
jgi:hypothetical protein